MAQFDLLVIGAGPGGYELAAGAAAQGLSVALVERDRPGGTCLNRGCIPTKCLCHSADVVATVANAAEFGVKVDGFQPDYTAAHTRMRSVVATLRENVKSVLRNVTLIEGEARFLPDGSIAVGDERYTAVRTVIATGSTPARIPVKGAEFAITSDELLGMDTLPESVTIIGGGVIGIEFAAIMNAFGCQVTVIEYCKEILPPMDRDIAKRLRSMLSRRGIKIVTSAAVTSIENDGTVTYECKGKAETCRSELVVMAVGRRPVIPEGIAEAGIELNQRGFIKVDSGFMTSRDGVYAVGDVNGLCMLAHAATAQAISLIGKIENLDVIPSAVFTTPEIGMAGLTEEICKDRGLDYKVSKSMFGANGKAIASGESEGFVKLIYRPADGHIYGCHILGPHASDLIQEVVNVMASDLGTAAIARAVHGHPTISEVVASAARSAH